MVERWTKFFGEEIARAICVHDQSPPLPAVRLMLPAVEKELEEAGVTLRPGRLLGAARLITAGDVVATTAIREGRARTQDEGSQLVAEIAAGAVQTEAGKILDCCAAPGGKTLILAERNPAARIVACEASRPRLKQLGSRLAFLGERVDCRLADATALSFDAEFDVVLADVPCSGTGTLSRNPEIRHRLSADDLPRQAERQRAILACALRAVRPGGRVVYSTCSLEPEENEDVVGGVVAQNSNARVVPLRPSLDAFRHRGIVCEHAAERLEKCVTAEGFLRLSPEVFGTDGFFIAMLERIA
jgi:16S rRNA (cytosine967-C5)-methyltransferase